MKNYLDQESFIQLLENLENNKPVNIYTESIEDGSVCTYTFMRMQFCGVPIILYDNVLGYICVLQDAMTPWEDCAEGVFEDLTGNDEYKIFTEIKL